MAVRWHWLYQDFLRAFAASAGEQDWVDAYSRWYLQPHGDTLMRLHFQPKGFATVAAVRARVQCLGRSRYEPMVRALAAQPRFEETLPATVGELLPLLGAPVPNMVVHVIVGLDCSNIYSLPVAGDAATVLCLEAVDADPAGVRLLLAHEAHHWARQGVFGTGTLEGSVGERLAAEGLAIAFSRSMCPGLAPWEYCFVPEDTWSWVGTHVAALDALIAPAVHGQGLMEALFARRPTSLPLPGMPPRTGYVYGFCRVAALGQHRLANGGVHLPWREALALS